MHLRGPARVGGVDARRRDCPRFASERAERLTALVLVDALGLTQFQPSPEFGAALTEYLSTPGPLTHDRLWNECVFNLTALRTRNGRQLDLIKEYNLDRLDAPGRLAALRSLMEQFGVPAIPLDILARIAVPTALIWGRHDRATPLSIAEEASKRLGWNLRVIDNAADDPALEQPEAFMVALRSVLDTSKSQQARL
jgi:pimeloyl-ACP methyl ester carboxylesterase